MKPTDIVFLLSGSLPMTIKKLLPNNEARCVWFTPDGDSKEAVFPVEILTVENPNWKLFGISESLRNEPAN